MANSYLSLHILADGCIDADINRAGEFLATSGAEFYNITTAARYNESEKLIRRLHDLAPNAKALWRGWHSDVLKDGDIWRKTTPQEWVNYRVAPNAEWLKELNVYVVTTNEVGVLGPDAKTWSSWEAACIRTAWEKFQVRLAVLRFSTGNPLDTEHDNYDDVLTAAGQYEAIITPNQYTALNGELSTDHHVDRHKWMLQRQDKLGVPRSKVVVGEYALCRFDGNNKPDPNHGYGAMNVNIDQHLTILKRDGILYQNEGTTVCWFTFGKWQEGGYSFDLQNNEPLLKAVETEAKAGHFDMKPTTDVITPPAVPKSEIVFGTTYRLRKSGDSIKAYPLPSATDPTITPRLIPDNAQVVILDKVVVAGDVWYKITYKAFTGAFYIQARFVDSITATVEVETVKLPPEQPTTPPPLPITPSVKAWQTYINYLREHAKRQLALADELEANLGLKSIVQMNGVKA